MKSIWQSTVTLPKFEQLKKDIRTDVLIIGGGIAGILTAYFLHQNGVKYALVEKDRICSGTTKNTTAKITYQHSMIYHKLIKSHSTEIAQKYLYANRLAFDKYSELCKNIDCDYQIKDSFVYSTNNRQKLENELDALQKIGYTPILCENPDIPVNTVGAVAFKNQAQFNPLKFISSIASDLNIYENTFVREMQGNIAITNNGNIYADKVVVATHFPFINKHGSYFLKLYQHRSYIIALKGAENVDGMYVDENNKGMTFRSYGDFLLLGGGGHRTGKDGGKWDELRNFAKRNYSNATEEFAWSAQDCMSLDDIPYIGKYSKSTEKLYVATGFNKWGVTGSMLSAMIICDEFLGKKNDYADIFSPSRSIIKPQLAINSFEAIKNLLTISEKRCPHLGCALKWNKAEHSWDCACHGSRFDENGKVLDNPANGDL